MSRYKEHMEGLFQRAKKGIDAECVSMIYDKPPTYAAIRRANRQLAPHNLVFRTYTGKRFWRRRGQVVPLDMSKPITKKWLTIADTVIFGVGGGC